jgi:hypothetical protein
MALRNRQPLLAAPSAGTQTLTPSLFTDANTFFAPTVAAGAVTLTPSLFTNSNTFFAPTVSQAGSPQTLTPSLFTNANTFFAPTVAAGAVTLTPSLFTNVNTFFAPTVSQGVQPDADAQPLRQRQHLLQPDRLGCGNGAGCGPHPSRHVMGTQDPYGAA